MDACMHGWIDEFMDGRMDGQITTCYSNLDYIQIIME
jgi:hypothetical protein